MLPSLKKDDVAVYYVSRTSNTDGVNSFLDKVDEVSSEPVPESWGRKLPFPHSCLIYLYSLEPQVKIEDSQSNGPILKELNVGLDF